MNKGTILGKSATLAALPVTVLVFVTAGLPSGISNLTSMIAGSVNKAAATTSPIQVPKQPATNQRLSSAPLNFIPNQGQVNSRVSFYLQGSSTSVYFTPQGLTYLLTDMSSSANGEGVLPRGDVKQARHGLKLDFVGANEVAPVSSESASGVVSYFKGSRDQWKTSIPTSKSIKYTNLWPGIDLIYKGTGSALKYEFHVSPGADPSAIKLSYRGANGVSVGKDGSLQVHTAKGAITDDRPFTYQMVDGSQKTIKSAYALDSGGNEVSYGFSLGDYDRSKPLVIDPAVLVYAGFLGGSGSGSTENLRNVAADAAGNAFLTGTTNSTEANWPDIVGPDLSLGGTSDAWVAKVDPNGTLVYAGYIGGNAGEVAYSVAVDPAGAAYVSGYTTSSETNGFPAMVGPDLTYVATDGFVAKVKPDGTGLVYAGYVGGDNFEDNLSAIAVDPNGAAYVASLSISSAATMPVINSPGGTTASGLSGFIVKIKADGTGFVYGGWLGGNPGGLAADAQGNAYLLTSAMTYVTPTVGPDLTANGGTELAVVKIGPNGGPGSIVYAGFMGGAGNETAGGIAIDAFGSAYITGQTTSSAASFPDKIGPDKVYNLGTDAFVAKIKSDGTGLDYAGYIGGSASDSGKDIAVDSFGAAYIVGETASTQAQNFPLLGGLDATHNGGTDTFVAKVNPLGSALIYSGYVGGTPTDSATGIGVDGQGNALFGGFTGSTESSAPNPFPITTPCVSPCGPDQDFNGGSLDGWYAKVSYPLPPARKPPADFDGNNTTDGSVYRNGTWYVKDQAPVSWGGDGTDKAVPGYYDAGPTADKAVYRTSTGTWYIKDQPAVSWGGDPSDIPVPGDYNADGITDLAVYRSGTWWIKDQGAFAWGGDPTDIPVPADYDGDGKTDLAVYRKATGTWYVKDILTTQWGGGSTDVPVPGNYNGDGAAEIAFYRKSTGTWHIFDVADISWGGDSSDVPVPGDYNADGKTDLAVFRKDVGGYWYIKDQPFFSWGGDPSDKALPLPSSVRD